MLSTVTSKQAFAAGPLLSTASHRAYALSRFPKRTPPKSRPPRDRDDLAMLDLIPRESVPPEESSPLWRASQRKPVNRPEDGLRNLLRHDVLVVERQVEMLNIFIGFEQSNKYSISNKQGETVGYIAEESSSFFGVFARQAFATHRPFKAVVMDVAGSPILWLRRPFAWINSRMFVQHLRGLNQYTPSGEPVLDTFAEVQQIWHPWRRRYELFIRDEHRRPVVSTASESQPEPYTAIYKQFANVDSGFLAWHFPIIDRSGNELSLIRRAFRGFGREIFTDTGQYFVHFGMDEDLRPGIAIHLTLEQRALILALAVNVDFDYFSRHSNPASGGLLSSMTHWE